MDTQNQIEGYIMRYFSGEITEEEKETLLQWLQQDPANWQYYNELRNIWQVSAPAFLPEEIDVDKAHAAVLKRLGSGKWYQSTWILYWQRIAAVLLLPLILLSLFLLTREEQPAQYAEIAYQEVFAPYGTRTRVNLADGSEVWLNAGSTLKYPVLFEGKERVVHLTGEAFFEVQSDKENPFIVETEKVKVRATGTAFNVEAYKKDSLVFVTMLKGNIDVWIGSNQSFAMAPGERMEYNRNEAKCEIIKTDTYRWCAWKDGFLMFRDDPLEYVFKKIGQTFNVDITVRDTSIAKQLYRATFEDESLDEILRLLKLSAPIQYKRYERNKTSNDQFDRLKIDVFKGKNTPL